jgi:predicted transcriptional regulator
MPNPSHDITDAELAVLEALWDQGAATIRQLTDVVYPRGGASHYATVQKLLERLEAKGCVSRDRSSSVHVFAATIAREELIGRRLRALADQLCGGSLTPLLTQLIRTSRLSPGQIESLRALIDELDRKPKPPRR